MLKNFTKARLIFTIGLLIFVFDLYLFFNAPVHAQSDTQPTANLAATANTNPDQPPTTEPDDPPQPTSEPAQVTGVPVNTVIGETGISTQDGATISITETPADLVTTQSVETTSVSTNSSDTDKTTPEPTLVPVNTDTPTIPESEITQEPEAPITTTSEATEQLTPESEITQEPETTETPIPATSEATEQPEATEQVETTDAVEPMALLVVPLAVEPDIELGVTCPSPGVASFTLRNVGGDMPAPGNYTVSNPAESQSFQLSAGQSISILAAGDATVNATYTTTAGTQVSLSATGQCQAEPTVTATPSATSGATLTPTNTLTPSDTPTITLTPTVTSTPTTTLTPTNTFTPTITLTPSITPTPSLTLTASVTPTASATFTPSNTPLPTFTFTPSNTPSITPTPTSTLTPSVTPTPTATATLVPGTPLIELNVACLPVTPGSAPQARFRLRNVGGDMLTAGTFRLQEPKKPLQTSTFLLRAGRTRDLIAAGDAQLNLNYSTLIFSNVSLGVTGTCLASATATLTPSTTPAPTIPVATNVPPPPSTSVPSTAVPPTQIPLTATNTPARIVTVTPTRMVSVNQVTSTATLSNGVGTGGTNPNVTPVTGSEACGSVNETLNNNFPVIDMSASDCAPDATTLERPAWTPVTVGADVCPDWLIYHTNMTGDWEIFRLGSLPDGVQADPNLSRGVGRRIYDLMPSRSPDQMWITFATNRDTNWEIYISAVEENNIQRVTYTPNAVELDPVWSPVGGKIVYESNRDGNWNLYLFDVVTGLEKRLTNETANEINAAWSPDGKQIVYQSDAGGFWQIYELDVNTLSKRRLSDGIGDDHGPQFSHDGKSIVFHSYRKGTNSVIYTMNADGSAVTSISDPAGNAINHAWSPDDRFIAYQSTVDGDQDVYVYELATQTTRKLTDNSINDYAPTWYCNAPVVAFTSDITGDSNIFSASVLPIKAQPIQVDTEANQLTTDTASDQYPVDSPPEENASRQDTLPSPVKNK